MLAYIQSYKFFDPADPRIILATKLDFLITMRSMTTGSVVLLSELTGKPFISLLLKEFIINMPNQLSFHQGLSLCGVVFYYYFLNPQFSQKLLAAREVSNNLSSAT